MSVTVDTILRSGESCAEPIQVELSAPQARPKRLIQLDVLRGIAIFLVLWSHNPVTRNDAGGARPLASLASHFGWTGVDLFFVLSGFLVGGLLLQELHTSSKLHIPRFLVRRIFKIWPSYFIFLAVVFFCSWPTLGATNAFTTLIPNLLHIQNYRGSPRTHTWSLAVEEHFYLVLPVLLALTWRRQILGIKLVPLLLAFFMTFCLVFRTIHWLRAPTDNSLHWLTHTRMDSLFFGVLLAYLDQTYPHHLLSVARHPVPALALALLLLAPQAFIAPTSPFLWTIGYTLNYLAFGLILVVFVHTPLHTSRLGSLIGGPIGRLVGFVGVFSYSIYLWHADVITLLDWWVLPHLPTGSPALRYCVFLLAIFFTACVIGILLGKLIEMPMLALRDRLIPSRAKAVTV